MVVVSLNTKETVTLDGTAWRLVVNLRSSVVKRTTRIRIVRVDRIAENNDG